MVLRPVVPAPEAPQPEASAELADSERRFARRKSTATNAQIISADLNVPISCAVREISTTGARIELIASPENMLGGRAKLPASFTLKMHFDRMEVDCAIVWRRGALVGVRFLSTPRSYARSGK